MSKKSLLFGAIASIIAINSVFADTTVTSKTYVDNRDALKQDKITAGTTGNVVTYNGTQNGQAQFSERAILEPGQTVNLQTDANKLLTVGQLSDFSDAIPQMLPTTTVTYKTCYQEVNGECILWNLTDKTVYGDDNFCNTNSDCGSICSARGMLCGGRCQNNSCVCYETCA